MIKRLVLILLQALVTVGPVFYLGYCTGLNASLGYPPWQPDITTLVVIERLIH